MPGSRPPRGSDDENDGTREDVAEDAGLRGRVGARDQGRQEVALAAGTPSGPEPVAEIKRYNIYYLHKSNGIRLRDPLIKITHYL